MKRPEKKERGKKGPSVCPARAIIPRQIFLPDVLIGENRRRRVRSKSARGKRDSHEIGTVLPRSGKRFSRVVIPWVTIATRLMKGAPSASVAGVIGRYALFLSRYRASTLAGTIWENVYSS